VIVVEHRDRLTWFGFGHLAGSLSVCGWSVVVLDNVETSGGLVRDVTGVLTLLCARLCGHRWASRWAVRAVEVATGGEPV
jgi:putative resolvase